MAHSLVTPIWCVVLAQDGYALGTEVFQSLEFLLRFSNVCNTWALQKSWKRESKGNFHAKH